MKVFSKFYYVIGNKSIPELFDVIDEFLKKHELHFAFLGYQFGDDFFGKEHKIMSAQEKRLIPRRKSATVSDLNDLVHDYYGLGDVLSVEEDGFQEQTLTNIGSRGECLKTGCTEASIREIGGKYPIPYYLPYMMFSYADIDFFGRNTQQDGILSSRKLYAVHNRKGSHISFEKCGTDSIKLNMVIEITDENGALDPIPYAQSMSALLGKKFNAETILSMTSEEERRYSDLKSGAVELHEAASETLKELIERYPPAKQRSDIFYAGKSNFSVPKSLKKIGKKFGFTRYRYDSYNVFFLSKPIRGGHQITFVVDSPPYFHEMRLSVHIGGLGFNHSFEMTKFYVDCQDTVDQILEISFEIIEAMEKGYFSKIAAHYPDTPGWYIKDEYEMMRNLTLSKIKN